MFELLGIIIGGLFYLLFQLFATKIGRIILLVGVLAFISVSFVIPTVSKKGGVGISIQGGSVLSRLIAALDSTTMYAYSKDAYLESVLKGRNKNRYQKIASGVPYYSSILTKEKLETAEPNGVLPVNSVVELGTAIRRGAEVWLPVSFYIEDKPQQAFALFPRDWEILVSVYNWDEAVKKISDSYQAFVKKNFELMEVQPKDENDYKEKYNDYYKVKGIGDKTAFYAPKTDKSQIDKVYSYFMSRSSINTVLLQADKEWNRPALEITKTEGK